MTKKIKRKYLELSFGRAFSLIHNGHPTQPHDNSFPTEPRQHATV